MNETAPNKTTSTRSFDDVLERRGIYKNGEPSPSVEPLFNSAGTKEVGLLWQSRDITSEWIGPDGDFTTYWNIVQLALPDHGLILCGYSFEYNDTDDPQTLYFAWDIIWKQTSKKAIHKEPLGHAGKPFRNSSIDRIGGLVGSSHDIKPWFVFDLSTANLNRIHLMDGWLQKSLKHMAKPARTQPEDRKPYPRILQAIYALDPTKLEEAIRAVIEEHPDYEDAIRRMIPTAFHAAGIDETRLSTADSLADDCQRSKRTILRVAKDLKCKPRGGKHGLIRFSQEDANHIYRWIHAETTRS